MRRMATVSNMPKEAAQAEGRPYKGGAGVDAMNNAPYGYWKESMTTLDARPRMPWMMVCTYIFWCSCVHVFVLLMRDTTETSDLDSDGPGKIVYILDAWVLGLLGAALSFLLVFRTNNAYARWWEGRIIWGVITFTSRDLARQATAYVRDEARAERFVRLVISFSIVMKRHLRAERELPELADVLTPEERRAITGAQHMVVFTLELLARELSAALRAQQLGEFTAMTIDQNLSVLSSTLGRCERILTTKMPFAYVVQLRTLLGIWLVALPFVTPAYIGWGGIVVCAIVAYAIIGLETISIEIEQPFGHEYNDLPLDKYADLVIKPNLLAILERYTQANAAAGSTGMELGDGVRSRTAACDSPVRASTTDADGVQGVDQRCRDHGSSPAHRSVLPREQAATSPMLLPSSAVLQPLPTASSPVRPAGASLRQLQTLPLENIRH